MNGFSAGYSVRVCTTGVGECRVRQYLVEGERSGDSYARREVWDQIPGSWSAVG
jgi:hypothetical protein